MTLISIVIPTYNAARTLDATLHSARSQSHPNIEIIAVDDGSTDETSDILANHAASDPRVKVVKQENAGVARSRNRGIEASCAEWVALLDADDVWHPKTIERFWAAADGASNPVVMVYTWSRRIDENGRLVADLGRPKYEGDIFQFLLATNFIRNASATMLRRSAVIQVGGYDPSFQAAGVNGAEDIDLYLRLSRHGRVAVAEGYHVGYRQSKASMSRDADRMRRSIEFMLEKLEREAFGEFEGLFRLSRAYYDLYAAGRSLESNLWRDLLRHSSRALKTAPVPAFTHLAVFSLYKSFEALWSGPDWSFEDLDPNSCYTPPVMEYYQRVQDFFARRAVVPRELAQL